MLCKKIEIKLLEHVMVIFGILDDMLVEEIEDSG